MATAKKTRDQIISDYGLNASNFSSHDMDMYDTNPNAFEGIASNKRAYAKAQAAGDTAGMKQANDNANRIRSTYSQYTGGTDGMTYTPSPKYELDKPTYTSAYQGQINSALDKIMNRGEFSNKDYDLDSDPVWQAIQKKYRYEGDLAYQDALAGAAGKTGGYASSADKYNAQMAQNAYMQQMNNYIPELYEAAYNRYLNETKNMNDRLQLLRDMEATDYGRYRDDVGDWERTRDYYNNNHMWQTERDDKLMQAAYENAMDKFKTTGVADSSIADALKIAAGTKTADYDISQQKINNEERWNEDASKQGWAKISQNQQTIDSDIKAQEVGQAIEIAQQYGYVPNESIAAILGVAVGTPTSDAKFKQLSYDLDKYKAEKQVDYQNRSLAQDNEQFLKSLALDKAKFEENKRQFNDEMGYKNAQAVNDNQYRYDALNYENNLVKNVPEMYSEMMMSGNPEQWLNENAKIMTDAELQALLDIINKNKSSSGAASILSK